MDVETLKSLLSYDYETGAFTWKTGRRGHVKAGQVAGKLNADGYTLIKVNGKSYMAHRLAWLYMTGSMPQGEIDHRNRKRSDNRFVNLREATRQQNCWNSGCRQNKQSGLPKGITFDASRGKYMARASVDGRSKNLGRFDTVDEAVAAHKLVVASSHVEYAAS